MSGPIHRIHLGCDCNNACVFCAQGSLRQSEESVAVSEQLEAMPRDAIVAFMGGEPTLHAELPEWIAEAHRRGATRVVVQTNGRRLANDALLDALVESGVSSFDVSLHGSSAAMHDFHTSVAGSFAETVAGLRRARVRRIDAAVTTVVTRSNYRHAVEIVRVAHSLGAVAQHFTLARPLGRAKAYAALVPKLELVKPYLAHAIARARQLGLDYVAGGSRSRADAVRWFAGIGVTERDRASAQGA